MAFGSDFDQDKEVVVDINMTPLVDVMLVLLIIFIIAVPVITHSVRVDLPRAATIPNNVKPETINLAITADGNIHWNEESVSAEDVARRLTSEAAKQPQPEIHIQGDRKVPYEDVIKVMAMVQRAGILKLGFVTDPGQ